MEFYNNSKNLDSLLNDIKHLISEKFQYFFDEKSETERALLNLPICKELLNKNSELMERIKNLEIQLIEKRTETSVKKKIELKISEKPLDKKNIIKKENLKNNADEIFLKINRYNSDDSELLSSDEDDDVKPIQISQNYSNLVRNLSFEVKNAEKEQIKNERDLLLQLRITKDGSDNPNSLLSNVREEMEKRKEDDDANDPQLKQLRLLTTYTEENKEAEEDEEDEEDEEEDDEEEDDEEEEEEVEDDEVEEEGEEDDEVEEEGEEDDEVEEEEVEEEVEEEDEEAVEDEEEEDEEVEDDEVEEEVEEEDEEAVEEDEEEELEVGEFVHNDGTKYWTTDDKNGEVFEYLKDGDIGDEIGNLQNGVLFLS